MLEQVQRKVTQYIGLVDSHQLHGDVKAIIKAGLQLLARLSRAVHGNQSKIGGATSDKTEKGR